MRADAKGRTRDSRRKVKADCRADTRGGPWAGIPVCVINSAAYRDLSLWARAILVELVAAMNGYNNGSIAVSVRELANALSTTNFGKISRATAELHDHGFVAVPMEGAWKERQAREFRLTFVSMKDAAATNDYLHWSPAQKSGADDVSAEGTQSADDVSARRKDAADDVSARIARHQRKSAIPENRPADDVSALIYKPYPDAKADEQTAQSDPISTPLLRAAPDAPNRIVQTIAERWARLVPEDREAVARRHGVSRLDIDRAAKGEDIITFAKLVAIRSTLTTWRAAA